MLGLLVGLAAQAVIAPATPVSAATPVNAAAAVDHAAPVNPNAYALFERDPLLKQWARRLHDSNGDGWLTLYEAQGATAAFKQLADGDRDGRVTTYEFDRAREFIAAR